MNHYNSLCDLVGYQLRGFETLVGGEGDEELRHEYEVILRREWQLYDTWSTVRAGSIEERINRLSAQQRYLVDQIRFFQRRSEERRRQRNVAAERRLRRLEAMSRQLSSDLRQS